MIGSKLTKQNSTKSSKFYNLSVDLDTPWTYIRE